jgi:hypothetical protein
VNPVRDDGATMRCGFCDAVTSRRGRSLYCNDDCRKAAWRARHSAPTPPVPAKSTTVYECDGCGERYLGDQRCETCNTWCRKVGSGGSCPHCDEAVAITDLITPDQFASALSSASARRTT